MLHHRSGPESSTTVVEELSKDQIIHSSWAAITFTVIAVGVLIPGALILYITEPELQCS